MCTAISEASSMQAMRPCGGPLQRLEQVPSIKEEPGMDQPDPADIEQHGVKREAEETADAEAVMKRVKTEPV